MGSYSDWITSRRELYKTAVTNAYAAHQASSGNDYEAGYDLMATDGSMAALIPPTNATAFYGGSPNATESQISTLQTWLQANPTAAGYLNLASAADASSDSGRKSLGTSGNVGSERRRWKGNPLYTFANGVLIGKNSKIIAALGTDGGTNIDGFGTDTLMYFDGIPFSKGTGLPGTAVFAGDVVVSGSIQGTNGIVIIDDVIQLERGVSNPAGIGVDDSGKIRLRHRGEGFLDLVDEIETAKSGSIDDAKLWVGAQNTSSARWGSSLIPNSNFASIENSGSGGSYAERPAGVISVGTNSNIISYASGIVSFNPNAQGIAFQAIPITADRYTVRIRYKGSANETIDAADTAEGLFLGFHETSDEDLGEKLYVYDNSTPAVNHEGSSVYSANTVVKYPTTLRSTDSSTHDGAPITTSYTVKSYIYSPSSTAKNASLVVWARNFDLNGTPLLDIDYIVMTEAPQTASEINSLITTVTDNIAGETGSDITDAQMTDKTQWAAIGGASLTDLPQGGDGNDEAIRVTTSSSGQGITSTSIDCASDTYLVGMRIKTSAGTTNIQLDGIETAGPFFSSLGEAHPKLAPGSENYRTKSILLQEVDGDNTSATYGEPIGAAASTKSISTGWKTFLGTYQPNKLNPSSYAIGYTTPTDGSGAPFILPGKFSLAIRADSSAVFDVDYVYAAVQGSSVNVAQELANSAYGDSQTFVTQINDLLIKESGSIVQNSSMALPSTSSNGPAGYRVRGTGAIIATVGTGAQNKSVKVTSSSAGNLTLVSPPFNLGSTDKYSIGVRIKSLESGVVSAKVDVAYSSDDIPTDKVTLAASGPSDVYVTNTIEVAVTIDDNSDTGGGSLSSNQYDISIGTSYQSILATWDRKAADGTYAKKNASIVITCDGDFEVDYILVKEQICSFDLADTQAQTRRDEAIAQAEGFTTALGETMSSESGSMIQNASFGSWYLNGSSKHRPHGWYTTRGASNPLRVIPATESTDAATQAKENVENINQTGSALKFTPSASGGVLSKLTQLPAGSSWTNPADASVTTTTGTYTFALRIRLSSAEPVGVRIYAHEYYDYVTAAETHVIGNASNTYGTATYEGTSAQVKSFTSSEGQVARIGPINVTTNDVTPGYDPDYTAGSDEWADVGDDRYVEYIPVDGSETDGDVDDTASTFATWYTIAGSYTPNTSTKQVSFEVLIDGDPDESDSNIPDVYIDYVNLVPQPFDTDFAQTLADARTQTLTGITSDGTFGDGSRLLAASILDARSRLATTEATLALESPDTSLLPNSFFTDYTGGLPASPHNWVGTRDTDATVQIKAAAYDSYNTYVELGANAVSDETHGMLSKAVAIVGDGITTFGICNGGLNPTFNTSSAVTYPVFDLVLRYRTLMAPTNVVSTGVRINATASDSATSNISALSTAPTTIKNGLGQTLTVTSASEPRYDVGDDAHTNTYWDIPWASLGDGSTNDSNATELIFVFHAKDVNAERDPVVSFTNSSNALVAMSGVVQVWNNSGTLEYENTFTSKNTIYDYTTPQVNASATLLSGDMSDRWIVFKLQSGFGSGLYRVKVRGGSGETTDDSFYVRNFNFFSYVQPSAEMVGVTMLAHEFYGDSLDSGKEHVFANGVSYTLDSTTTKVQRYNSSGTLGGVQTIQTILSTADSALQDEKVTTLNSWNTLVGAYTPSASAKWVSFEFAFNEDKDGDNILPLILVDGILLQQSDGSSLAQTIKTAAEAAQSSADANTGNIIVNSNSIGTINTSLATIEAANNENMIIQTGMGNEQDSLIANAGFLSPKTITNNGAPAGFFPFAIGTPGLVKIQNLDSTQSKTLTSLTTFTSNTLPTETVTPFYDAGQNDTCMAVLGTNYVDPYKAGFYTTAMMLPTGAPYTYTDDTGASVTDAGKGKYTIAFKVKPASGSNPISVSIFAHEYDTSNSPATDGNYVYSAADSTYKTFGTNSVWNASIGAPVISTRSPIAINTLQLSNPADSSPSTHEVVSAGSWTTVGGTYSPTSTAACVSFSVVFSFDTDDSTADNTAENTPDGPDTSQNITLGSARDIRAIAYVDYILCMTQTLTADLADNLAAGRAYTVQQTLGAEITTLEGNLGAESDSLMPNGNFAQKFTDNSIDYVKNWLPTGNSAVDKLRLYAADSASKSIGTYVKFNKNASGGSAPYGNNKSGIISKAILNPVEIVRDLDGNINAFNIGMRIRGTTDIPAPTYSAGTKTQSYNTLGVDSNSLDTATATLNAWSDLSSTAISVNGVQLTSEKGDVLENYQNHSSYGNSQFYRVEGSSNTSVNGETGTPVIYDMGPTTGKSTIVAFFGCTFYGTDNRYLWIESIPSGSTVKIWWTTDAGSSWNEAGTTFHSPGSAYYWAINNALSNGTSGIAANYGFAVVVSADPTSHTATFSVDFDMRIRTYNDSEHMWITKSTIVERWEPNVANTPEQPDFSVKLIAHETYEAVADPNIIIRGPLVSMDSTSIPAGVGIAVPAAFTSGEAATGTSSAQNLIDLRYSNSTASTEITIDASAVDDDSGEAITDWRHIVGSYTPNEATTAVSFEILIDHEKNGDSLVQEVWLDSVTMAVSSVGTDLASTIADNRVFVEQNFEGGCTPISPNNVIVNADMAGVFLDGTTKRPQNWAYWSTAAISGGYDNIFVSPDTTATNRAITFKKGTTYTTNYGIISRPFRITSEKYKIRIVYNVATGSSTASGNIHMIVNALTYDSELSVEADSITQSSMYLHPTSTAYMPATGVNSDYTTQIISNEVTSFSDTKTVIELTWTPITMTSSTRPNTSALPLYASIALGLHTSSQAYDINIWEISAVPEGQQYPSYQFGSGETKAYGTDFDDDGDVLPDAPRETESKEPLYQSIDIQVSDTTQSSPPKNRLLMALPRKYFPDNNSDDPTGTSYLYPGVSDLEYTMQDTTVSFLNVFNLGPVGDSRSITFPSTTNNSIKNVSMITFQKDENPSGNIDQGWYNPSWNGGSKATGAQIIEQLGGLWFDEQYEPGGWTGDEFINSSGKTYGPFVQGGNRPTSKANDNTYINSVGSHIANVKSIYVGTKWNSIPNGSITVPFWDGTISSTSSSANLNGYGTTLGNTTSYGTGARAENVDLAKYNRAGGIYIKQAYDKHGVHFIDYNSEARTVLGYNGSNFAFNYAPNENTALTEIGYLANASNVNQITFTGQHRNYAEDELTIEHQGLIVVSTGVYKNISGNQISNKPNINESLPVVRLSSKRNQKSCFGVVSNAEDPNDDVRTYQEGRFVSTFPKEEGDERLIINSLGEGAIWICNINGNLENGDYVTTCEIAGYGMLQDDDLLHNYTVAKITQDCIFELDNPMYDCVEFEHEGNTYRKAFVGCTYHCG